MWGLNWLALISWRRAAGQHWSECARRLYPVAAAMRLNLWIIPLNLTLVVTTCFPGRPPVWWLNLRARFEKCGKTRKPAQKHAKPTTYVDLAPDWLF